METPLKWRGNKDLFNKPALVNKQWLREKDVLKEKSSFGIACCRKNGSKQEILLVCKRYTYAFSSFAHGKYNSSKNTEIIDLFNNMTIDEKNDILSLNFSQIWYRIWLGKATGMSFFICKNKFDSAFVADGGIKLRRLMSNTRNANKIWEIPKGRKKTKAESDIHCAVREFYEETGVKKKDYVALAAKRTQSFIDANVSYKSVYYFGLARPGIKPRINFLLQDQVNEIGDIRWMDLEKIRIIDYNARLETTVRPIFNFMKKYYS